MDNSFYLKNGSVLWNGAFIPLDMAVEDGRITALSRGHHNEKGLPEVDAAGLRVLPGFLDLHTHGAAGVDVNAADAEGLRTIGRFFASQGVTGWLCSVLTTRRSRPSGAWSRPDRSSRAAPAAGRPCWASTWRAPACPPSTRGPCPSTC